MKKSRFFVELTRMAWRSLARHKVKTLITTMAIMVSVAAYIFLDSWIAGMSVESRRNIVNYETGAAKLQTKRYFEKKDELPSYETFSGWERYRGILDNAGYNSAPRYVFTGTLFSPEGSVPILFNAVDPAAEAELLAYPAYMESGRYIQSGAFELVLGTMAAEKLKVGIPQRPHRKELEELAASAARDKTEAAFIAALYESAQTEARGMFAVKEKTEAGNERMILKQNISKSDMERYWNILAESGRNNVRVSAVIDIKAVPEQIRSDKWEGELMPALAHADKALIAGAYRYDEFSGIYVLNEAAANDETAMKAVLEAMLRADFSGTVRHINQLFSVVLVGVVNSPDPMTNANTAYLPLDVLQGEEGMMLEGQVTELLIRGKDADESKLPGARESSAALTSVLEEGLAARGESLPSELAVFTWLRYVEDYLGYESMEGNATKVLSAILLLLAFLGISNTILLAILERTREIGMMRALGMTGAEMTLVYMLEAGFLGCIGSALGVALGCILTAPMVKYGMDFSAMSEAMGGSIGFRVASRFRAMWNIPVIAGSGIAAMLIASLMAYFPIRRALTMPITESLRFE